MFKNVIQEKQKQHEAANNNDKYNYHQQNVQYVH